MGVCEGIQLADIEDTSGTVFATTETYSFGEWLKQRRERLRLTQRELALSVHCSVPMIKKIESDERHPSVALAALLAITLQVPQPQQELFIEVARGQRPVDALWHVPDEAAAPAVPLYAPVPLPEGFYRQLQATHNLDGTPDALPVDLMALCARAALVATAQGQSERAVTLASLAEALRAQTGQIMLPPLQARLDEALAGIRVRLSERVSNRAWRAGQTMSLAEAFEFLLG